MRQSIMDLIKICCQTLPMNEPIYEFGSLQVPGQEGFADIRPLFPGKEFFGCDMRPGPGVDKTLDLHCIELQSQSVGTVMILDTLEHVEYPRKALEETYRILKTDGIVVLSSVMDFCIHGFPYDYWRFTPEAFRSLLRPFSDCFVGYAGNEWFPHTVIGIGVKSGSFPNETFIPLYDEWKKKCHYPYGKTLRTLALQMAPVAVLDLYRKRHFGSIES